MEHIDQQVIEDKSLFVKNNPVEMAKPDIKVLEFDFFIRFLFYLIIVSLFLAFEKYCDNIFLYFN